MDMRPHLQIQTIIKAITEDIIPALDQGNQLAMQSAQLAIGTLTLISQHLPLEYRFDCDELGRLVSAAGTLGEKASDGGSYTASAKEELDAARISGREVLERARAEPAEILAAIRRLRSATAETVRATYAEGGEATQAQVAKVILSVSAEQLLRDRSWLLMQGWEPDPKAVPAIEGLLTPVAGRAS